MTDPQPTVESPDRPPAPSPTYLIGPVGLVVAGFLGAIGGLLPWVSARLSLGGVTQSLDDGSLGDGFGDRGTAKAVVVALAAVLVVGAAYYLFGRRQPWLVVATGGVSLLLLGTAIVEILDVNRQADDLYRQMDDVAGGTLAGFPGSPGAQSMRDVLHIGPGTGLWLVAAGGLVGIVLSLLVLWQNRPVAGKVSLRAEDRPAS